MLVSIALLQTYIYFFDIVAGKLSFNQLVDICTTTFSHVI